MPRQYIGMAEKVKKFEVRPDDVWIVALPKSGTSWAEEMLWMIVNDVDEAKAKYPHQLRTPFFEMSCVVDQVGIRHMPPPPDAPLEVG